MTEDENARAAKVLTRARSLFKDDNPGREWPVAGDLAQDEQLMRVQARYLQRAEKELLAEGRVESVDQS